MHLKVFVKLKKPLKTLSSGQKNPKKPKKTKKNPKKTKNPKKPTGTGFFFNPGFFQPWSFGPKMFRRSTFGGAVLTVLLCSLAKTYVPIPWPRKIGIVVQLWARACLYSACPMPRNNSLGPQQLIPMSARSKVAHVLPQGDVMLKVNKNKQLGGVPTYWPKHSRVTLIRWAA